MLENQADQADLSYPVSPIAVSRGDLLRDFGRADVRDTPHNRAARAAFYHSTPGRFLVELEELPEDVDAAIDENCLEELVPPLLSFALLYTGILIAIVALAQVKP